MLSLSQHKAYTFVMEGHSAFISGPGGTGKSFLIQKLMKDLSKKKAATCATTGVASVNIGSKTLHSLLRIFNPGASASELATEHMRNARSKFFLKWVRSLDILIIDEVSMLSAELFDKIETYMRILRQRSDFFGGLQIVLVGDFFQLPPIKQSFLFDSTAFGHIQKRVELTEVHRQKDPVFAGLLLRMRTAELTDEDIVLLQSRVGAEVSKHGIEPTILYSRNMDVDAYNTTKLDQLSSDLVPFSVYSNSHGASQEDVQKLLKDARAQDIALKVGAQVMLSSNLNTTQGLCNGSRGVVTGFAQKPCASLDDVTSEFGMLPKFNGLCPVVDFLAQDGSKLTTKIPWVCQHRYTDDKKRNIVYCWSLPLRLAWATTIHKSQSQTLDCVQLSIDSTIFEPGQAYVACSRCRTLEGLTFTNFDSSKITSNAKVVEFYKSI